MEKELSEMTLEELWDLFPIFLVQHDDQWNEYYNETESKITDLLAGYPVKRISHIGSTAIQGIWAKNIVDVIPCKDGQPLRQECLCQCHQA